MDHLDGREVLDAQHYLIRQRLGRRARVGRDLATHHHLDNLTHGRRGRLHRANVLTVAQDRNTVGQFRQLRHTMRDEDQARRRAHKVAYQLEQRFRLGRGQGGRRLVHDKDLRIKG